MLNNLQRRSGLRTISCSTRAHSLFLAAAMAPASATLKNSAAQPAPAAASATQPAPQRRNPVSHDDPRWCVGPLPSLEVVHVHSCQNKAKDLREIRLNSKYKDCTPLEQTVVHPPPYPIRNAWGGVRVWGFLILVGSRTLITHQSVAFPQKKQPIWSHFSSKMANS